MFLLITKCLLFYICMCVCVYVCVLCVCVLCVECCVCVRACVHARMCVCICNVSSAQDFEICSEYIGTMLQAQYFPRNRMNV